MSVEVRYDPTTRNTEAFTLLAEAWNEMMLDGIAPERIGVPPYQPDDHVLYAISRDRDIVGCLVWGVEHTTATIKLFYVEPSSRETGVFTSLYEALKSRLYADGVKTIQITTYTADGKLDGVLASIGAKPVAVIHEAAVV